MHVIAIVHVYRVMWASARYSLVEQLRYSQESWNSLDNRTLCKKRHCCCSGYPCIHTCMEPPKHRSMRGYSLGPAASWQCSAGMELARPSYIFEDLQRCNLHVAGRPFLMKILRGQECAGVRIFPKIQHCGNVRQERSSLGRAPCAEDLQRCKLNYKIIL